MASNALRNATELMVQYARYHRDRRNIATHFVGIPLIVFAIGVLLARARWQLGEVTITATEVLFVLGAVWYLTRGNLTLALATVLANGLLFAVGEPLAQGSAASWLAWGLGSFVVGWVIQFIGHYYEGRKPAFVDDLIGLMVGPMFVVGEALFSLGWGAELLAEIERSAGPTVLRDLAHPAA
ncbi:MAG: DUF962 domain-containing protein [Paucibacter sp.]|nr:DUF962 domain-containing protein [Roseateles sp.]